MKVRAVRDGLLLGAATLPLSISVTQIAIELGLSPWMILVTAALMFSAAAQLLLFATLSFDDPSLFTLAAIAGVGVRLSIYACRLNEMMSGMPVWRRALYLLPLTDISYVEFTRSGRDLDRYVVVSRCLWLSWITGTGLAVVADVQIAGFPKEAVGLLIFVCLTITTLANLRRL